MYVQNDGALDVLTYTAFWNASSVGTPGLTHSLPSPGSAGVWGDIIHRFPTNLPVTTLQISQIPVPLVHFQN